MTDEVLFQLDTETRLATVTLNRPEQLNGLTQAMLDGLAEIWRRVRDDDGINAVVLRGAAGSRAFTAGVDLAGGQVRRHPNPFTDRSVLEQISPRIAQVWKPIICAVHGICAGAGLFLVNDADIALCSEDAEFFDPHMSLGITSAMGPIGMMWKVNPGEVLRYTLLSNNERLGAETALRIGLVTETAPDHEALWARAEALGRLVAGYNTVAVQGTLKAIWEAMDTGRTQGLQRASLYSSAARGAPGQVGAKAGPRRPHVVR